MLVSAYYTPHSYSPVFDECNAGADVSTGNSLDGDWDTYTAHSTDSRCTNQVVYHCPDEDTTIRACVVKCYAGAAGLKCRVYEGTTPRSDEVDVPVSADRFTIRLDASTPATTDLVLKFTGSVGTTLYVYEVQWKTRSDTASSVQVVL